MAHAWKACWVQALGGSNPPSSATGPRDRFRFRGFCCLWRRWCSGRRRARPPARSPHASLRLGVVDLEARPCPPVPPAPSTPVGLGVLTCACASARSPAVPSAPSGALHTGGAGSLMCALRVDSLSGQAPPLPINFARNSPAACSNIECASLELQRFWGVSKNDHDKLRATFGQCGLCCRLRVLGSDSPAIPALVIPEAAGVLQH